MTNNNTTPAQVDLRGFSYALKPYVTQQTWKMEKLQMRLANARMAVKDAELKHNTLCTRMQTQSEHLQQSSLMHSTPFVYQQGLMYLKNLRQDISAQNKEIEALEQNVETIRLECVAQQRKLDGLMEHRSQTEQEYIKELVRHESAETDRDWISRSFLGRPGISDTSSKGLP